MSAAAPEPRQIRLFEELPFRKRVPPRTRPSFAGRLERLADLRSRFLPAPRDVVIYLPPGYDDTERRYPVVYMQDGQNLFDPATSFVFGKDWRLGETLERGVKRGEVEPAIVVGVYNTGVSRIDEYAPSHDAKRKLGGKAPLYAQLLVEELKPYVDARYRTRPGPESTGVGGSSMGALASLYLGIAFPGVFGRVAALSPSAWWDQRWIVRAVEELKVKPPLSLWLDMGTREGAEALVAVRQLRAALRAKGFVRGRDLSYREVRGATHDELSWSRRAGSVFSFLFPPARPERRWLSFLQSRMPFTAGSDRPD